MNTVLKWQPAGKQVGKQAVTTLAKLREANACKRGYDLIANAVGRDFTGDIPLIKILEVNGVADCIWALRTVDGGSELAIAIAIYCVEQVKSNDEVWMLWATNWMSGVDRTAATARTNAATVNATDAARNAAAAATVYADYAADYAAAAAYYADYAAAAYYAAAAVAYYAADAKQREIVLRVLQSIE